MSEPDWTHLEPSEIPDAAEGYAIEAAASASAPVTAPAPASVGDGAPGAFEEVESDEADAGEVRSSGAAGFAAVGSAIGSGAALALRSVGRLSPRARIGLASGLSILALAGALVSRGVGRQAPTNRIPSVDSAVADQAESGDVVPPTEKPKSESNPKPDHPEQLADAAVPPSAVDPEPNSEPLPESKKGDDHGPAPLVDPLAEKLPVAGLIPDTGAVLAAADSKDGKNPDRLELPAPESGDPPPTSKPATEDLPLPPPTAAVDAPSKPAPPTAEKPLPLPDGEPPVPPPAGAGEPPAPDLKKDVPVEPLPPIGADPGKSLPPPSADSVEPPLSVAAPPAGADLSPAPANPIPPPPGASAPPPSPEPASPASANQPEPLLPPSGNQPKSSIPDAGKPETAISAPGLSPINPAPSSPPSPVSDPAPPPSGLKSMDAPSVSPGLIAMPPKELPRGAVAAAGVVAGAAAAGVASSLAGAVADESGGVPIRNAKASRPHDLNASDDPRGDDALGLFGSGPETSAVSPPSASADFDDSNRRFEIQAPVPKTKGRVVPTQPEGRADRVEAVYHQVASGENFWTISRLFYGSGRYYMALWGANKQTVPVMEELHVGQVIVVPAQEDLDPTLIQEGQAKLAASSQSSPRAARPKAERDSNPAAADRPLKVSRVGIDRIADEDDDDFAARSRSGKRPRSFGRERDFDDDLDRASDVQSRREDDLPVHKVRPRETLRSIARDRLGNSRRADEILQLNRGLIDDPANLVAGQILALPEDARPGRR